jgi:HK97 family phage major capsid protein
MDKAELKKLLEEIKAEDKAVEEKVQVNEKEGTFDIKSLADELGDRIAKEIVKAKGGNSTDAKQLKNEFFNADNGFKAIEYPDAKELSNLEGDEKITTFFKALVTSRDNPQSQMVMRALVEGTDSQGGYLVPEEFRAEVWRILPDVSVMRKLATVLPMNTDTLDIPTLVAKPEAYWTSEYASKTTSSAEFGQVTLTPYKLVCLLPVTQELIMDAGIDLVRFITTLFAERIGEIEDKAYFVGTGTGQPTGLNGALSSSVACAGGVDFDEVIDLIMTPPQAVRNSRRTAFVANKHGIKLLRTIKDSNNNYIWSAGRPDVSEAERLYGYPLYEMNSLPARNMIFGDFSNYVIGDRQQLSVSTTMEGGDSWRRDSMEIKAKVRVDGKTLLTGGFALMTLM